MQPKNPERLNTYHDQWYMVENLRPRLRPTVGVHRQLYGGVPWYILNQADANANFRLTAELYEFAAMMDGVRTIEEIWRLHQEHGTRSLTQGEVISLLGKLNEADVLSSDVPQDTQHLLQRRQERRLKKLGSTLSSFLFLRFPLWSPDAFFSRYQTLGSAIFCKFGLCVWLALLVAALHALTVNWSLFAGEARLTLAPANIPWLYAVIFLSKTVHEFGHGFACKYFSAKDGLHGEVHSLGIMFLFFVPVPYVDVSSSVRIRSRGSRAAIALAGVYTELLLAFIAALAWAHSTPGTALHLLARNCMIMTSVSTILFNINPLLRFDGYFVFSDLADLPNLYQRSQAYTIYLIKRYLLGVTQATTVVQNKGEKQLYPVYAVAAFMYRLLITWGIFFILEEHFYTLGFVLACALCFFWFCLPLIKGIWWMLDSQELAGLRGQAQLRLAVVVGLSCFILFGIPVDDAVVVEGVVESRKLQRIYADAEGVLTLFAPTDTPVVSGQTLIAHIENPGIVAELETLRLQQAIVESKMKLAQATGKDDETGQFFLQLSSLRQQWVIQSTTAKRLRMLAPTSGVWVAPHLPRRQGKWITKGDLLGSIYAPHEVRLRTIIDQFDAARIFAEPPLAAAFIVSGRPDVADAAHVRGKGIQNGDGAQAHSGSFRATLEGSPIPAGRRELFHPSLSQQAGGSTAAQEAPDGRLVTESHIFELRLLPENNALPHLAPGQRVDVRLLFGQQALGTQWVRRFHQFFREQ